MTILRIIAIAWATLLYCVPARAETTADSALRVLCGPRSTYLAPHVEEASRRYLVDRVLIVAVMRKESHCRARAMGKHGDTGLMQVRGVARNGLSRRELMDPRTNILTGTRWLSLMTTWCGTTALGLGAYNTGKCGKGKGYARRVLALVREFWRAMDARHERRS